MLCRLGWQGADSSDLAMSCLHCNMVPAPTAAAQQAGGHEALADDEEECVQGTLLLELEIHSSCMLCDGQLLLLMTWDAMQDAQSKV